MDQELFNPQSSSVTSSRILYTPSTFARTSLLHLQKIGSLQAIHPHTSTRTNLTSFLCFVVLSGNGTLICEGTTYELSAGDCVFIDCRKAYSHSTGYNTADNNSCSNDTSVNNTSGTPTCVNETACEKDTPQSDTHTNPSTSLWSLQWCHFYAPFLPAIYEKYKERGGSPVFHPDDPTHFTAILTSLYTLASSSDYIRDMRINESLSALLTLLMEQSWHPESKTVSRKRLELVEWTESKMYLILCGSSMSFMESQVLGKESPLYGRKTARFKIAPLDYKETAIFHPNLSDEDNSLIYGITGGIPHDINKLDVRDSVDEALLDNLFDRFSYLYEEPANLIKQELREPAIYNAIIKAIRQSIC